MKNIKKYIWIMILTALMVLASCDNTGTKINPSTRINDEPQSKNSAEIVNAGSQTQKHSENIFISLRNEWAGRLGTYHFFSNTDIDMESRSIGTWDSVNNDIGSWDVKLYFTDAKTGERIVLCNKPNCKHDNDACNAFFSNGDSGRRALRGGAIFALGDKLYVFHDSTIIQMNEDGTGRSKLMEFPDKYGLVKCYLYGGKVYALVNFWSDAPDFDSSVRFGEGDQLTAMLEFDIASKTYREIYNAPSENEGQIIGFYNEMPYYLWHTPTGLLSGYNQAALDKEENGKDVIIYSRNLKDGKKTDLLKDKSFGIGTELFMNGNHIYYHSRREKQLYEYNVLTGNKRVLVNKLAGYVDFFWENSILDNKLFYIMRNNWTNAYANPPKDNDTFYVDLKSGKSTKLDFKTTSTTGRAYNLVVLPEEQGGYFTLQIHIEAQTLPQKPGWAPTEKWLRAQYGKIKIEDFLANKLDRFVDLHWVDFPEDNIVSF